MATYAVGYVHGNLRALDDLLNQLESELLAGDSIVFLWDYIDSVAESRGCIDRVLQFQADSPAEVVCLMGNYEEWLLETMADYFRHSWILGMAGLTTVKSYSKEAEEANRKALRKAGPRVVVESISLPFSLFFESMPISHELFLTSLSTYHRSPEAVCTHAGLDTASGPVESQSSSTLLWGRSGFPCEYDGTDKVIYGHCNNARLNSVSWPEPLFLNNTMGSIFKLSISWSESGRAWAEGWIYVVLSYLSSTFRLIYLHTQVKIGDLRTRVE